MEQIKQTNPNKFGHWLKTSITARMLMVGILSFVLLIPLFFIEDLIRERSSRQQSVINEINQQWGNEVLIYGPILKLPYKVFNEKTLVDKATQKTYTETIETTEFVYIFPENIDISSSINPEEKQRGIYTTAVYNSDINIAGNFDKIDLKDLEIKPENIIWEKAKVLVKTSNVKGVNEANLVLNQSDYTLTSKYQASKNQAYNALNMHVLETKNISEIALATKKLSFKLDISIKGSDQIRFIPIGKTTEAQVTSNWKTANFFGEFLPYNDDKVNDNGFDAKWKVLDLNRPFSQLHKNYLPDLKEFAFGVNFMIPVDEYQKSERSVKYGFLVIALTFLIFFLIQTLSKINIHPFQYLMIGLALVMFYTLLVSISEHSNFLKAYVIAGASVVLLITFYSKSILKTLKFPLFIGASLTALYSFIFVIIQLENYALLVGSIGLFIILSTVMYVSRKIDWHNG